MTMPSTQPGPSNSSGNGDVSVSSDSTVDIPKAETPSSNDNVIESPNRPRRRAAKVDYSEKKEDDEFDTFTGNPNKNGKASLKHSLNSGSANTTDSNKREKRQKRNGSTTVSSTSTNGHDSRSQTPNTDDDTTNVNDDSGSQLPINYQPVINDPKFSYILNLKDAVVQDKLELILKDGTRLKKDDTIYLICEPPGEPYYIGRIMGFVTKSNKLDKSHSTDDVKKPLTRKSKSHVESADNYLFKINWWYRSRDISKISKDSRLVYASMHSDTCPLQSFRGKCVVKHRDEIEDFEDFKSKPNQFWFDKLFDRYMIKFYDVLPTSSLKGLPPNYHEALRKRFQYIFVEQGKGKDMLQSPKSCVKCNQWSSPNDSVECCECQEYYHMLCLDPPLYKKPPRGFAWSCIKCTKKLEERKLLPITNFSENSQSDDFQKSEIKSEQISNVPIYEELAITFLEKDSIFSFQERRNEEEWIYRYLGMHAKLEDALDDQDRPYARAASRLGTKNQLTGLQDWFDHPVKYYDNSELNEEFQRSTPTPSSSKRKKVDNKKKKQNANDEPEELLQPLKVPEEYQDTDPSEFPPWLQERPKGYIERGGDDTAELMWVSPKDESVRDKVDQYIEDNSHIAKDLDIIPTTPNFVDTLLKNLLDSNYDFDKSSELNKSITRESLREPTLTPQEIKKFEQGVKKFGSELRYVFEGVKSQPMSVIVRFYYLWKKTPNGRLIWGNFEGRKKNRAKSAETNTNIDDDIANDADDSSYDVEKTSKKKLICKHCKTNESIQWYKSPGAQHIDDGSNAVIALCMRCARLWRRYAVVWEEPTEVIKKQGIKGQVWKKRVESELLTDSELILKARSEFSSSESKKRRQSSLELEDRKAKRTSPEPNGVVRVSKKPAPSKQQSQQPQQPQLQQEILKEEPVPEVFISDILTDSVNTDLHQLTVEKYYHSSSSTYNSRVRFKEFAPSKSHLINNHQHDTQETKGSLTHCSVCITQLKPDEFILNCSGCGITVHPTCYGVDYENLTKDAYKWHCDPCSNDLNPIITQNRKCSICHYDGSLAIPLKRTVENQWAHIICALFTEGIKFKSVSTLQPILHVLSHSSQQFLNPKHIECHVCNKQVSVSSVFENYKDFKIGFIFQEDSKPDSKSVKIENSYGKVVPAIACLNHDIGLIPFHTEAKRFKQAGVFTLFNVLLEDFKKEPVTAASGCQARFQQLQDALSILNNLKTERKNDSSVDGNLKKTCVKCKTSKTMVWKKVDGSSICYNCFLSTASEDEDDDDEIEPLHVVVSKTIDEKLDGSKYGISSLDDRIKRPEVEPESVYKPEVTASNTPDPTKSTSTPRPYTKQVKAPSVTTTPQNKHLIHIQNSNGGFSSDKPTLTTTPLSLENTPILASQKSPIATKTFKNNIELSQKVPIAALTSKNLNELMKPPTDVENSTPSHKSQSKPDIQLKKKDSFDSSTSSNKLKMSIGNILG